MFRLSHAVAGRRCNGNKVHGVYTHLYALASRLHIDICLCIDEEHLPVASSSRRQEGAIRAESTHGSETFDVPHILRSRLKMRSRYEASHLHVELYLCVFC